MEFRKRHKTVELKHEATINDETDVVIVFGDGTERTIKVSFDTYASQDLGIYKK